MKDFDEKIITDHCNSLIGVINSNLEEDRIYIFKKTLDYLLRTFYNKNSGKFDPETAKFLESDLGKDILKTYEEFRFYLHTK